jgi:hypothetical protein
LILEDMADELKNQKKIEKMSVQLSQPNYDGLIENIFEFTN